MVRIALFVGIVCFIGCQDEVESIGAHTFDQDTLKPPPPSGHEPHAVSDPVAWGTCPPMHWEAGKPAYEAYTAPGEAIHLRPDGRVLEWGWIVYDPAVDAFSGLKIRYDDPHDCEVHRAYASYTLLGDGKTMMLAGGGACDADDVVDLIDTDTGEHTVAAHMIHQRDQARARRLPNGKVLMMGGWDCPDDCSAGSELYDPTSNSWSLVPTPPAFLDSDGGYFRAVSLANGDVFVTGSVNRDGGHTYIYSWQKNEWRESAPMPFKYVPQSLVLLKDGRVMFVGIGDTTQFDSGKWLHPDESMTFIFDPATESFSKSAPLHHGRAGGDATLLPCGDVLVGGGGHVGAEGRVNTFELYDPARDQWFDLPAGSPAVFEPESHLVTLPNGDVLGAWGVLDGPPEVALHQPDRPLFLRRDRGS